MSRDGAETLPPSLHNPSGATVDRTVGGRNPIGVGPDLARLDRLKRDFETEADRILCTLRRAHYDISAAYEKLHDGLALELYAARKEREWRR